MTNRRNTKKKEIAFTYEVGENLYINLTNRCDSSCWFCDKTGDSFYFGKTLKINRAAEKPASYYIKLLDNPEKYKEIVFCGFGEPTIRLNVLLKIAKHIIENGGSTRLNTNGHGNKINKRNIVPELKEWINSISISLNAINAEEYARIMKVKPQMHLEMINFANECVKNGINTQISVVCLPGLSKTKVQNFVDKEIPGAQLKVRHLTDFGNPDLREKIVKKIKREG